MEIGKFDIVQFSPHHFELGYAEMDQTRLKCFVMKVKNVRAITLNKSQVRELHKILGLLIKRLDAPKDMERKLAKLKNYLFKHGIRQNDLAKAIGVTAPFLSQCISGDRPMPDDCRYKIIKYLRNKVEPTLLEKEIF